MVHRMTKRCYGRGKCTLQWNDLLDSMQELAVECGEGKVEADIVVH